MNWNLETLANKKQFGDYMPYPSQILQENIRRRLEESFLHILQDSLDHRIRNLPENIPLIKRESQMRMKPIYSPTCDIAIGPFSFRKGNINRIYNDLAELKEISDFITDLQEESLGAGYNEVLLNLNRNPRCFIAIEVENTTASDVKHLLGSIINCSLLGKIGIVVVFDKYLDFAKRLLQYLAFVKRVKKAKKDLFRNVFVISKSHMDSLLQISE